MTVRPLGRVYFSNLISGSLSGLVGGAAAKAETASTAARMLVTTVDRMALRIGPRNSGRCGGYGRRQICSADCESIVNAQGCTLCTWNFLPGDSLCALAC